MIYIMGLQDQRHPGDIFEEIIHILDFQSLKWGVRLSKIERTGETFRRWHCTRIIHYLTWHIRRSTIPANDGWDTVSCLRGASWVTESTRRCRRWDTGDTRSTRRHWFTCHNVTRRVYTR